MSATDTRPVDSVAVLERAIRDGDTRLTVAYELIRAYADAGREAEALALMARVAALVPRPGVQRDLSRLARRARRWDLVEVAEQRYTELCPDDPDGWQRLAVVCRRRGNPDATAVAVRRWAALSPDDAIARHLGAAASGARLPRADAEYVRRLFDQYAPRFDEHIGALDYRAPQLIAAAIERAAPGRRFERAADLGCGTGLLGVVLRERVAVLDGVDLSPAMLERARAVGCYDSLSEGDLVDLLCSAPATYDLLTACDTLNYFGDLRPVLNAAAAALVAGGVLAFTLESDGEEGDHRLTQSGRFVHGRKWVSDLVVTCGFAVLLEEPAVLRREGGADVPGLVVVAGRPDAEAFEGFGDGLAL